MTYCQNNSSFPFIAFNEYGVLFLKDCRKVSVNSVKITKNVYFSN